MQILIVIFSLTALGALYGMVRYGGWNFSIHSANVVFLYVFLFSVVTVLWSWIALREMEQEEAEEDQEAKRPDTAPLRPPAVGKASGTRKKVRRPGKPRR